MHAIFQDILLAVSAGIFSIGLFLAALELKSRFERSFVYYGATLMLLSFFSAIDLLFYPESLPLKWINFQHILFCFVPHCISMYQSLFIDSSKKFRISTISLITSGVLSLLFLFDCMFSKNGNTLTPTSLYYALFLPLACFSIGFLFVQNITLLFKPVGEKKFLYIHLTGGVVLATFGFMDLYQLLTNDYKYHDASHGSLLIFGVSLFTLFLTYAFSDRLVSAIKERFVLLEKLHLAYSDLDTARSLSDLGKSTSIINHEIKNYACVISGYSTLVIEHGGLEPKFKEMVQCIQETALNLVTFSSDILNLSKSKIIQNKRQLNLPQLIRRTIDTHFHSRIKQFSIEQFQPEISIYGDWEKLEHSFVNIFKNAFEAHATSIRISFISHPNVVFLSIEDDGAGCNNAQFAKLFTAFYTTKGNGGTGLGLSISRSIVEAHGGHIAVASKNIETADKTGLIFKLSFPKFETPLNEKDDLVLLKGDFTNEEHLTKIITTFRNVYVTPHVLNDAPELGINHFPAHRYKIIGGAKAIGYINQKFNNTYSCTTISFSSNGVAYAVGVNGVEYSGPFNEEFILSTLVPPKGVL